MPIFFFYSCENKTQEDENLSRISELEAREQQLEQQQQEKDKEFTAFVLSISDRGFKLFFRNLNHNFIGSGFDFFIFVGLLGSC